MAKTMIEWLEASTEEAANMMLMITTHTVTESTTTEATDEAEESRRAVDLMKMDEGASQRVTIAILEADCVRC
jgi:hypothetical protein